MDYNQYEATPLFSYDQSRTAIRQMKSENNRQMRESYHQTANNTDNIKWQPYIQFGSAGILVAGIIAAALFS